MAKGTDYAKGNGLWVAGSGSYIGYSYWWLRSPGHYTYYAAYVILDGDFDYYGHSVGHDGCGVRPALWIRNQ